MGCMYGVCIQRTAFDSVEVQMSVYHYVLRTSLGFRSYAHSILEAEILVFRLGLH